MKYFLDTEFIEEANFLDLISIGIVSEDGREFYCENADTDWARASEWVQQNVRPHLSCKPRAHKADLAQRVKQFIDADPSPPEFWGYYASWDWTALCWLMGGMMHMPKGWPMFCRDLRQYLDAIGMEDMRQPDDAKHHALSDAKWAANTYRICTRGNVANTPYLP